MLRSPFRLQLNDLGCVVDACCHWRRSLPNNQRQSGLRDRLEQSAPTRMKFAGLADKGDLWLTPLIEWLREMADVRVGNVNGRRGRGFGEPRQVMRVVYDLDPIEGLLPRVSQQFLQWILAVVGVRRQQHLAARNRGEVLRHALLKGVNQDERQFRLLTGWKR